MNEADVLARFGLPHGTAPLVDMRGIGKVFPGVIANAGVDLTVYPGEIHALLGENGAGKSTLMNVLTGIYRPDAGEIVVNGEPATFATPQDAIAAGIGMVHQHFKLVEAFTVAENIHLGWTDTPARISRRSLEARTSALGETLNLAVNPRAVVADLSTGERQRVEIMRVLSRDARLLILDEPTAVLTPQEARELFAALRRFTDSGHAVIFISHKLEEVIEISDRVTILRGGRHIATEWTAETTSERLARQMVGRDIVRKDLSSGHDVKAGVTPAIALDGVTLRVNDADALKSVSLTVAPGEILGIAGVAGNGQRELAQVMTGLAAPTSGRVHVSGMDLTGEGPLAFARAGLGHIPEDRLGSGMAASLSIIDNAVLREYRDPPVSHGPVFTKPAARRLAADIAAAANVRVADPAMPARNLSGGNQQRLVARREMRIARTALVAAYPSRGLDVGAIEAMMRYLLELRDRGVGVVVISEELEELINISDRIAVLFQGAVMGELPAREADIETLGLMMGGHRQEAIAA